MAEKRHTYDVKYKIQAVKSAEEPGGSEAATRLTIPENTMYT